MGLSTPCLILMLINCICNKPFSINTQALKLRHNFIAVVEEDLRPYAAEIKAQIDQIATLSFTQGELELLIDSDFLLCRLPCVSKRFQTLMQNDVEIDTSGDQLAITIRGTWLSIILWEVPLLAIICEIRCKHLYPQATTAMAIEQLKSKIDRFYHDAKKCDSSQFALVDFGTRRRFSKDVHHHVVDYLKDKYA